MKTLKNISVAFLLGTLFFLSCQDDYLTDGGISKAETELTAYDYLDQHKYSMFDTLIQLIDYFDLKETINSSGTFFAPCNYSIQNYLDQRTDTLREYSGVEDTTYTLATMMSEITADYLLQYILKDKVTLDGATTKGKTYTTLTDSLVTVKKILATDDEYSVYSSYSVYLLYYCKEGKEEEVCQTTGILTQDGEGTILHVLNNEHIFGVFSEETEEDE